MVKKFTRRLSYMARRHPVCICIAVTQLYICLWYISTSLPVSVYEPEITHSIQTSTKHLKQRPSTPLILQHNHQQPKISRVKIFEHVQKTEETDGVRRESDAGICSMENYLASKQELCFQALTPEYGPDDDTSALPDVNTKYVDDRSCDLGADLDNCVAIRSQYIFGKTQISADETEFPLAFGIKIHGFANQAHRLLRYIYRPHNVYCIHVDKKAFDVTYTSFVRLRRCFDNVIVVDDRVNVVYSSIRQVEAEMKCINAVKQSRVKWKYYINLTGQEFMLKTNQEIVRYLKSLNGSNDIESNTMPGDMFHRFTQKAMFNNRGQIIITKVKKAPLQHNVKLRKGSAYGMLSRDFINFVLNHPLVSKFIEWLKDTYAPEETIWGSLNALKEAPGGDRDVRTYQNGKYKSRAVKWQSDRSVKCFGKYVHWICIYSLKDLPWLFNSDKMVANKFYEHFEPLALDCLETEMYKKLVYS